MQRILSLNFAIIYILIQILPGYEAGLPDHPLVSEGAYGICATCRLGRGKCRKKCKIEEIATGLCRQSMYCCYLKK